MYWHGCQTGRKCNHRKNRTFSHISQLQLAYRRVHLVLLRLWTSVILDQTAGIGDALLMSCRQPCTCATTHAIVEATSTCGWPKRCGEVCGPCVKLACVDNQVELCPLLTPSLDSSIGFGQPCSDYSRFLRLSVGSRCPLGASLTRELVAPLSDSYRFSLLLQ